MISNFKFKILNSRGITLIEIIVVVFIIALFSSIAFLNLPKIQGSFALNSAAYELAQNIRTAENDSLTGVGGKGKSYVINFPDAKHYEINDTSGNIDKNNVGISIKEFDDENGNKINDPVSISFTPPNPITSILDTITNTNITGGEVDIVLSLDSDPSQQKIVSVNTSGLIQVK